VTQIPGQGAIGVGLDLVVPYLGGSGVNTGNASSYSFTNGGAGLDIGPAADDRAILALFGWSGQGSPVNMTGITIGGVAANLLTQINSADSGNVDFSIKGGILSVPAGTSLNVGCTLAATVARMGVQLIPLYGLRSLTPLDTDTQTAINPGPGSSTTQEGGILIGASIHNDGGDTWTGITQQWDFVVENPHFRGGWSDPTGEPTTAFSLNMGAGATGRAAIWYSFR